MEETMEAYVFKLNLEPSILQMYQFNKEQIEQVVIPSALNRIFQSKIKESNANIIEYNTKKIDIDEIKANDIYVELVEKLELFHGMYLNVVKQYEQTGAISYSQDFMFTRDLLNQLIKRIFDLYPILEFKISNMKNVIVIKQFSRVKMGATYLQRAAKLKKFVDDYTAERNPNITFYYDLTSERIYLQTGVDGSNDPSKKVRRDAGVIQDLINEYKTVTNIGKVSINPVYNLVHLEGLYNEITIEIVYPNGNPSEDRSEAIEQVNAAKEIRKLIASKGQKIDASDVNPIISENARKGYLTSVTSRGKSIIKGVIERVYDLW